VNRIIGNQQVSLHTEAAELPVPSGSTESSLAELMQGGYLPSTALLTIDTDPADATVVLSGPVTVRAKSGGRWRHVGTLNAGNDITVSEFQGFEERVYLGGSWEHLVCVATGVSGGSVTVRLRGEETR
jgi:UbiD family decarboxylase